MLPYHKLFNKNRRECTYKFKVEENGRIKLFDSNTRFYFMGYRRINRYLYPKGLELKKESLKKKYCNSSCNIEPGDIVVEIGANVGEFTIMAARNADKVFAFEPDPNCFYCLKENTKKLSNVNIIEYGASKVNKHKAFYLLSEDADSSLLQPKVYTNKINIKLVRLDSWMDSTGLSGIDFLKIDAEGAEMEVLEGLGEKIEDINKISVDGSPERYGKPTADEVSQFLQQKGFTTQVVNYQIYAWKNLNNSTPE